MKKKNNIRIDTKSLPDQEGNFGYLIDENEKQSAESKGKSCPFEFSPEFTEEGDQFSSKERNDDIV